MFAGRSHLNWGLGILGGILLVLLFRGCACSVSTSHRSADAAEASRVIESLK
jgi:hypothetical protein